MIEDGEDFEDDNIEDLPIGTLADCGAHKLNLVASVDITKHCEEYYPGYLSKQNEIIAKLSKLSLQNMSTIFAEEFKERFGTKFKVGVETRWFSKVEAVEDYLQKLSKHRVEMSEMYKKHRKNYRDKEKKQQLEELGVDEIEFLKEYVKVGNFVFFLLRDIKIIVFTVASTTRNRMRNNAGRKLYCLGISLPTNCQDH